MKRFTLAILGVAVSWIAVNGDTVEYRDPKTGKFVKQPGIIQSADTNKIIIKPNIGKARTIKTVTVKDVEYDLPGGETKFAYRRGQTAERNRRFADALKEYTSVEAKVKGELRKHMKFKIAYVTGEMALSDDSLVAEASDALAAWNKANPNSWQTLICLNMLGDLYTKQGEFEKAASVFDNIIKLPGLEKDTRAELEMKTAKFLLQAKKHKEAETRLTRILKSYDANDPKTLDLRLMIITCQAHTDFKKAITSLEQMIAKAKNPNRIALAYNTLGWCYQQNNQPKEALYNYLYVDLIYNEDRAEHKKAVGEIVKLFKQLKRNDRVKEYEAKLKTLE